MQGEKEYFVYFLKSIKNKRIYTGKSEKHPEIRVKQHNDGSNTWTKQNGPFVLIYFEKYYCKKDMDERERFFKTGFGKKIRNAILKELTQFQPEAGQPLAEVRA